MSDQLPPHSVESERSLLAAILLSPGALEDVRASVRLDSFYDLRHQAIYAEMCAMQDDGRNIDPSTLYVQLSGNSRIEDTGGLSYLSELPNACQSAHGLSQYRDSVIDLHLKRRLLAHSAMLAAQVHSKTPAETILEQAQAGLEKLCHEKTDLVDAEGASQILFDDLERRFQLQGNLSGISTGFRRFDEMTDGLQYADQTIIASRPSIGKTAIGLNIFFHAAVQCGVPALFVSLEMSIAALMRRMASYSTTITMKELRKGSYTDGDFKKLTVFRIKSAKAPMWFLDGVNGLDIAGLCAEVRRACRKLDIKLVVIDYLQRIRPDTRQEKRTYEVGDVSTRLAGLADQTGAAFLTLAQLNRDPEKDNKPRAPRLADLGDSKQIEQDADTVALLHRNRAEPEGDAFLIIAKQRDGEVGQVKLKFNGPQCRFENPFP